MTAEVEVMTSMAAAGNMSHLNHSNCNTSAKSKFPRDLDAEDFPSHLEAIDIADSICGLLSTQVVKRNGKMILELRPVTFMTQSEEKADAEQKQVEQLKATVDAKKAWLRVSQVKQDRARISQKLEALQKDPSIELSQQLQNRIQSEMRLADSEVDVAVHDAQLKEVELQRCKLRHHEAKITILQAKISAVEHMKLNSQLEGDGPRDRFFCDCFQGLSTWYCRALLERGWYPYPSEEWFVTATTKLQIWSPLAKTTVDLCDTASFSRMHVVLWEGGEWLEEKVKLAELLKDTDGIMPPTYAVSADGEWSQLMCGTASDRADGCEARKRWYIKESSRNYGTGISVCQDFSSCREKIKDGERFVVQLAVEPQMLIRESKFAVRLYLLIISHGSNAMDFYTYEDGWISLATKPYQENNLEWDQNVARDRSIRLREWGAGSHIYPICRRSLSQVMSLVRPKLVSKGHSFELFGVDYIIDQNKRPWLLEMNRSPRQQDTDKEKTDKVMTHSMFNLIFGEDKAPPKYACIKWKWDPLEVG